MRAMKETTDATLDDQNRGCGGEEDGHLRLPARAGAAHGGGAGNFGQSSVESTMMCRIPIPGTPESGAVTKTKQQT
jgi:hypothetical protein